MEKNNVPYTHLIFEDFISSNFNHILEDYPVEQIKEYCANPAVSEYDSALDGNYSAPVLDKAFTDHIEHSVLAVLKQELLGNVLTHDHHYCNYHMDEPGSSIDIHNDYKDFRWLITSQCYFDDSDQGVRLLDIYGREVKQVPCKRNMLYSIPASPYTWHNVEELAERKHSILFRVGQRRHRTIAHPSDKESTCYIIINDDHCDTHYAKLGPRMGNLTEAWLHSLGVKNIMHSPWRDIEQRKRVIKYATEHFFTVRLIHSGYFPPHHPDINGDGDYVVTVDSHEDEYNFNLVPSDNFFLVNEDNYKEVAENVFFRSDSIPLIAQAEKNLLAYHNAGSHLNYKAFGLPKL